MRDDIFTRMACARRPRLLATEFYLTSTGCSNPLRCADRIWLRSVEWEATRVGDVIGARHGGARKAKFRPPLLHPVPAGTNARADQRSLAPRATARSESSNRQAGCSHTEAPRWIAVADRRRFRDH